MRLGSLQGQDMAPGGAGPDYLEEYKRCLCPAVGVVRVMIKMMIIN